MINNVTDEILELYRYLANRNQAMNQDQVTAKEEGNLMNYHRIDRVMIKYNGLRYKRITRIRSMKV
jgi:hypothetical protein